MQQNESNHLQLLTKLPKICTNIQGLVTLANQNQATA